VAFIGRPEECLAERNPVSSFSPWPPPTFDTWAEDAKSSDRGTWILEKLLPADGITLVSGPPKTSKKTLAVFEMIRHIVSARSMGQFGYVPSEEFKTLFLEYEGPALPFAQTIDWMDKGSGWEFSRNNVFFAHRYSHVLLTDPDWAGKIQALIQKEGLKGLVVDTFTRAAMAHENDAIALSEAFRVLDQCRTATDGGFVIYIHHLRKNSDPWEEDIDVAVRGNTAFSGAYDHHLAFRPGYRSGSVHLYTRSKVDEDRFFRWQWRIDDKHGEIAFEVVEFELANPPSAGLVQECTEAIEDTTVHTLRQLGELWDVPRAVAAWLAGHMTAAGILEKTARGFRRV